jgi:hypothetical protein
MTKKQKTEHIMELKKTIEKAGYMIDRWGSYKKSDKRIKIKKNNIRIEKKTSFGWVNLFSKPIIRVSISDIENRI